MSLGALLVSDGCARLVTINPGEIPSHNDPTWKIRQTAQPEPRTKAATGAPDSPVTGPGAAVAETVPPAATAVIAAPTASPPVEPLPFRKRPAVLKALQSPADGLGVPEDLYAVDPLLAAHRREMESQASARHSVAGGTIVLGLLCGAIAYWAISVGASHQNDPNESSRNSAGQAIFWGVLTGALGLGEIIGGIAVAASSSDPTPLQTYYRETYLAPRDPGTSAK